MTFHKTASALQSQDRVFVQVITVDRKRAVAAKISQHLNQSLCFIQSSVFKYYSISVKNFCRKLAFDFSASSFEVQFSYRAAVSARKRIHSLDFLVLY